MIRVFDVHNRHSFYTLSDALFNGISNAERGYHHVVCGWCMRKLAYSKFFCFTSTKVNGHLSTHKIELNSHIHRMISMLTQWLTDISPFEFLYVDVVDWPLVGDEAMIVSWMAREKLRISKCWRVSYQSLQTWQRQLRIWSETETQRQRTEKENSQEIDMSTQKKRA